MNTYRVFHVGVVHVMRTKDRYEIGTRLGSARFVCDVLGSVTTSAAWLYVVDGPITCMTCMCNR